MRNLADRYRDLFPAVIGESAQDSQTGAWRHAWVELTPAGVDVYTSQPGARSGTAEINYALALPNRQVPAGTPVWMRHRDQQGELHFEFLACPCCCCSPCYQGVEIVGGPALPYVDASGGWQAADLSSDGALVVTAGAAAVGGVFAPLVSAPATASSAGAPGQVAYDGSFWYVCTAPSTWVRAALSTW